MGYGRRGRGGSTSRHESNDSSKEKKENKPAETDVSADEIRRMVAKFLKELSGSTNPRKAPRLLNKISEEKIRALGFMSKLKYVTEPELIDKYIEAEARRKEWFESQGWDYTPNVDPTRLPLMSYDSVADICNNIHGQTVQPEDKHDAFVTFMGSLDGPLRLAEYDKMICAALLVAFGKRTINSTMKLFGDISIQVNGSERLLDDVITYVGKLATVNHDLGDLEPDELQQVIEVLNTGLSKAAPALGLDMRTDTEGKGYSVDQYCEILVDKATKRMEATDAFADWEKDKSKGNRPLSDAERLRLNDLEKEVAQLKKENAQLKAAKSNNPSTSAAAVGNKGCFKCGKEGHRKDQCPDNKPTPTKTAPTTPRTSGAKSAGQSGRKVSFSKLQLDTAVKNAVQETVAEMEKKGWQKP